MTYLCSLYFRMNPAAQLVKALHALYDQGLTTASGGNLSLLDDNGDIWITPSGPDKGFLQEKDIVRVKAQGEYTGLYPPSSELPMHRVVYEARPDLRTLLHAHPPYLVSLSLSKKFTPFAFRPLSARSLPVMTFAPYACPGSIRLGGRVAKAFSANASAVLMQNHGVIVGGQNLTMAMEDLEVLELLAGTAILSEYLGRSDLPTLVKSTQVPEFSGARAIPYEKAEAKEKLSAYVDRCLKKKLFNTNLGSASLRLSENTFLINQCLTDSPHTGKTESVLVNPDTAPMDSTLPFCNVHHEMYRAFPEIKAVFFGYPLYATSFSLSGKIPLPVTIPESLIVLRQIHHTELTYRKNIISLMRPAEGVTLLQNGGVICTGESIGQAYERFEVLEFTARTLFEATLKGEYSLLNKVKVDELGSAFPV